VPAAAGLRLGGYRSLRVRTPAGRVHVLEARGRGRLPTLVLLHGFAAAGWSTWPLFRRLRPHFRRLVIPDLPAHGLSEPPPGALTPGALAEPLVAALDQVLDEPALVFGNSLGGALAVHVARARPELARGVLLASPGGAAMTSDELADFRDLFRVRTHADALRFIDRVLVDSRTPLRPLYALGLRALFRRPRMRGFLDGLTPDDCLSPADLAALRMPVLLLWGRGDRVLPRAHRDYFVRHLPPHAVIEEPGEHGHCPYLDDADACAARVLRFARSLAPTDA
jgi:pimeloyl-ACP methyl ester carboxylesterase